jgi:hypothetical protein
VRANHVALELFELFGRDAHVGEQSDAGVDGVDGGVAERQFFDHGARAEHGGEGGRGDLDGLVALGDALEFIEGEVGAVEGDHGSYRCTNGSRGIGGWGLGVEVLCALVVHF